MGRVGERGQDLVFLERDLPHLSVAHERAGDFEHPLSWAHTDDVVGWQEAWPLSDLTLQDEGFVHGISSSMTAVTWVVWNTNSMQ